MSPRKPPGNLSYTPNSTTVSNCTGTFAGMLSHGDINQADTWSWKSELQSYKSAPLVREDELARSKLLRQVGDSGGGRFPAVPTAYERGQASYDRVLAGVAKIGGYSRLDLVEASTERPVDPIVGGEQYGEKIETPRPPAGKSKARYDPIRGCYEDEKAGKEGSINSPGTDGTVEEELNEFERKERAKRTVNWTPSKPKGGRIYKEGE